MDENCEDKQDAMQCKIKKKNTWNIWKNGLNKKIYEKLTDESGRKKNQYE